MSFRDRVKLVIALVALGILVWQGIEMRAQQSPPRYHVQRVETVGNRDWVAVYQVKDTRTNTCWAVFRADGFRAESSVQLGVVPCD